MFPKLVAPENEDKVFLLASEISFDETDNVWEITLQPGNELVALNSSIDNNIPTIKDIRNSKVSIYKNGSKTFYKGNSLFSAGVILIVNDKFVMLQRDNSAPVDPDKWTCPAGRCSSDPRTTSLKEFYEELLVCEDANTIFFNIPGAENSDRETYKKTILRKRNSSMPINEITSEIDSKFHNCSINVYRGSDKFKCGSFWAFYDDLANTLEMRIVARVSISEDLFEKFTFEDGELFNRKVDLFSTEQLKKLPLVSTMEKFMQDISACHDKEILINNKTKDTRDFF